MSIDYSHRPYLKAEAENKIKIREFNENSIVCQKGDSGDCMYEVMSGGVGIYIHYKEPNEVLLAKKFPGEFFGEIALLENRPRTATVVALYDKTKLREISSTGFIHYVREHPDNLDVIIDAMSDRFKEQRNQYFEVCEALMEYKEAMDNCTMISGDLAIKIEQYVAEGKKYHNNEQED